jgi:hypothetical protein
MGKVKIRRILLLASVVALIGLVALVFRGPHVSNFLKKIILPELTAATGKGVTAQKIYLNIFPLFVEAKDVRVFDDGSEVLHVSRIKGYLEISGLLRKEIVVRRIVVREPDLKGSVLQLEEIIANVKKYLGEEKKTPFKAVVRTLVLDSGRFEVSGRDMSFRGSGFGVEAVLNPRETLIRKRAIPRIGFRLKELSSSIKGWPELKGEIRGAVAVADDFIALRELQIGFFGSKVNAGGTLSAGEIPGEKRTGLSADLQVGLDLLVESFRSIFGLKQPGEGEISGKGTIHLVADDLLRSVVEMKLKGNFYVQTLMELLKVEEKVEGLVDFTGGINGPLDGITGTARARLKGGNLFEVKVDELTCGVRYGGGRLNFTEGKGRLYNGHADAEATISVTGENYYSVKVNFFGVDSSGAFDLIGWDPGIPAGKVQGALSSEGADFNPSGWYSYESVSRGNDVLGRVRKVRGSFDLRGDVITLSDSTASTDRSTVSFSGTVDTAASTLALSLQGRTADLTDITTPYLHELTGAGEFSGTVTGKSDNPVINGKVKLSSASYEGYDFGEVRGDVTYRRDLLDIRELASSLGGQPAATGFMEGTIRFPEAAELFDLKKPVYALSSSLKNGDVEKALKVIYKKRMRPHPGGRFDTVLSITGAGPNPLVKGTVRSAGLVLDDVVLDAASLSFSYDYTTFRFEDFLAKKGDSLVAGSGSVSDDDSFRFILRRGKIYLGDIPRLSLKGIPTDSYADFKAEGSGTMEDPRVELEGTVHGGKFKDIELGGGTIRASVKNKEALFGLTLLDGRATLSGKADLRGDNPWTARLDLSSGRYDFVVGIFLKEVPEDLLVNMKGYADITGDRSHFSARAVVNQLNVALYGNSFSNDSDIKFEVDGRNLTLSTVRMRSGTTSFKASGEIGIGRDYNIVMEGSSSLAPLKGFSKKIDVLRGDAGFVFSLTGKWDTPRLNGGVTLSNALFGLKDVPYRISEVNGYLYMDEDRIVMQKLSGKVGGGAVELWGAATLQGFALKRFYVNAAAGNIGVNISREFTANFDGSLYYTGTPDSQTLSGELKVNRALYREPVQWQVALIRAKARERPRGEIGAFEKTRLNVRMQGADNIVIDNNIARASVSADIVVRGTVSSPLVFGRIDTKGGIVYFRNNEFRILSATADFADTKRINPTMYISAETTVEGYNIRLFLEGTMEHFNLSLSSTPSLEQIEILSLLTVGTLSKEPKGIQSGIGVSAATSFLSGQVQDIAQERVRSITGIDRIGVESSVSRVTGKSEQRLTVSKRLLGDRVSVTYATALGTVATDVIRIEYNIGHNVALVGVRDEVGALGGSIKFRFGFK